jgi:hypothetical protein
MIKYELLVVACYAAQLIGCLMITKGLGELFQALKIILTFTSNTVLSPPE